MKLTTDKAKSFFEEFRNFAFKGNMVDLAVGVVIGAAFGTVIKSIVDHVIMPLIDYIPGLATTKEGGYRAWHVGKIEIGLVLADLLNFILVAAAVFLVIVKVIGGLQKLAHRKHAEEAAEPTTKECPRCISTIPIKATKCPQCTSDLPESPVVLPA